MRSMEVSGQATTELRLLTDRPDVIIRPDLVGIGLLDKVDPLKLIAAGERAAVLALPGLRRSGRISAKIGRRMRNLSGSNAEPDFRHDLK